MSATPLPPAPSRKGRGGQKPPPLAGGGWGRGQTAILPLAAFLLTWPAILNGYPLVFSDTGTYLSQALNRYLGWDRPPFYSLFMLPLHMGLTTWPVIAAQGLITAWVLHLTMRALVPACSPWPLVPLAAVLAMASPLPWFAAQLMPDLFTGLLVLALALLVFAPERLRRADATGLAMLAAFAMCAHLSNLPLALGLLALLLPLRRLLGARAALGRAALARVAGAPIAAVLALIAVNLAGHGAASIAPYGNVFLLARVIEDGPGRDALTRACPDAGWRLCAVRDQLPARADDILWRPESPLNAAGGPKRVSAEADAIVAAAIRAEPGRELAAMFRNAGYQILRFGTGDGLQPWPDTVTPWIDRDFPRFEQAAYAASRQATGQRLLPNWMSGLHQGVAMGGIAVLLALLPRWLRQRDIMAGLTVAILAALLGNAAITGALSGPHDRYQSRIMWLPSFALLLGAARRGPWAA
ncbi:MAG TPA: hypothetical protein VJ779_05990 [Acetobacteraceae bacterium]|nr:hypothetical protein [Acetobacteraceae bacterium]